MKRSSATTTRLMASVTTAIPMKCRARGQNPSSDDSDVEEEQEEPIQHSSHKSNCCVVQPLLSDTDTDSIDDTPTPWKRKRRTKKRRVVEVEPI